MPQILLASLIALLNPFSNVPHVILWTYLYSEHEKASDMAFILLD